MESSFLNLILQEFDINLVDAKQYSPLTLAFIGDGIYDIVVRTIAVASKNAPVNKLHKKVSNLVKASAQVELFHAIEVDLTEEERAVYKRGRNAKSFTSAKNATMIDYRVATGLEALIGYLYLNHQTDRMIALIRKGLEGTFIDKCKDNMNILVRLEEEKDYHRVEEVTKLAFSDPERIKRGQIGCPFEHWMVHELRKRDGIQELSLVAEVNDSVIGHIICSKAIVKTQDKILPVLNLGPISVLPEYQRRGVGKALIKTMIDNAKLLGYGAILFFGRPEYYPQFGFKEALTFGITDSEGYNYPSFMGMELIPQYLSQVSGGKYYESDIYNDDLNRDNVKAFDDCFTK